MAQQQELGRAFPLLPGLVSSHHAQMSRTNFRRGQLLERMAQGKLTSAERTSTTSCLPHAPNDRANGTTAKCLESRAAAPVPSSTRRAAASSTYRVDASKPAWLTLERLVLRFFAYFIEVEQLADGGVADRVRRVVLCFYLSDRSISISEPRVANSGLVQGEFMRRTVVRKSRQGGSSNTDGQGDRFSPEDFCVGGQLQLYGRTFHLVDCDAATRKFYAEALGQTLSSPRRYPDDTSSATLEVETLKRKLQDRTRALSASKAEATRKFHDLSHKVLRFFASWRDEHPLYPETRRLVVHYYLCDDTLEVLERQDGSRERGRGHFGVLLSRRKLAREVEAGRQPNDEDERSYFITDRDLRCGEKLCVFSRRLLLEDCDPFTRDYYLETYGITQEKLEPSLPTRKTTEIKWQLFQATPDLQTTANIATNRGSSGYAANNNNSSMRGGLAAPIPEVAGGHDSRRKGGQRESPIAPFYRSDELDGKQLRFRARFQGLPPGDPNAQREFVVTFYLEDETLAVFEPRVRNSGVLGGRFLDRARFRKSFQDVEPQKANGVSYYRAQDLYVGAALSFEFSPRQRLELLEADSQTLSYCESHPETFRFSDSASVMALLAQQWLGGAARFDLRCECRRLDANGAGVLSSEDMKRVLNRTGVATCLNAQQMITLLRRFVADNGGKQEIEPSFVYDDFCDAVAALLIGPSAQSRPRETGGRSLSAKLAKGGDLRRVLIRFGDTYGLVEVKDLLRVTSSRRITLSKANLEELLTRFGAPGERLDVHRLCDYVFQLPTNSVKALDPQDIDVGMSLGPQGDEASPPSSVALPTPDRPTTSSARTVYSPEVNEEKGESLKMDPRVVRLMQRAFAARKYQLRKALRERDQERSGRLREEEFMDAVLSVAPHLSDNDSYLLADVFFPTNNSHVNYPLLLDSAFRE